MRSDLFGLLFFFHRLQQEEEANRVFFDAVHQVFEEVEGFLLVFDERIALTVAAQADAFLQVVHREKVIFPVRVHDLQHDHAFVIPHGRRADDRFLLVVFLVGLVDQRIFELFRAQAGRDRCLRAEVEAELLSDGGRQARRVSHSSGMRVFAGVLLRRDSIMISSAMPIRYSF